MYTAFVSAIPLRRATEQRISAKPKVCMSEKPSDEPQQPPSTTPSTPKKIKKTILSNASFSEEFLPEFGEKGPGSRPPWDLRPKSLKKDVENPDVCDGCRGTGLMTCSFCSGTSFHTEDGKAIACPACQGKKVTCSVCFGTKKNIELEGKWWEKGVAALFRK
ncbi:unnamed protein product [Agarophyton chilense]